jgi:hypothetical protein
VSVQESLKAVRAGAGQVQEGGRAPRGRCLLHDETSPWWNFCPARASDPYPAAFVGIASHAIFQDTFMYRDPKYSGLFKQFGARDGTPPTVLQKVLTTLVTIAVFGVALMFSVVFFAVIVTVGAVAWGYLWWKTRALRKHMREQASMGQGQRQGEGRSGAQGLIIEGEVIREVDIDERPSR